MLAADRTALICDLAETYHVYDYRALPVTTLAALACGLRGDSRIAMKMAGRAEIPMSLIAAAAADELAAIHYMLSDRKGLKKPVLFYDIMYGNVKAPQKVDSFASGEEFMRAIGQPIDGG